MDSIQLLENQKTYIENNENTGDVTGTTERRKVTHESTNNLDL